MLSLIFGQPNYISIDSKTTPPASAFGQEINQLLFLKYKRMNSSEYFLDVLKTSG